MSAMLKQKLIDIANGFTKYGLWKGGGSSALSEMTDVTFTNLQANDVLKYNGSVWVNDDSFKIIGNTDISSIGDGTLTGGLSTLNSNLINLTSLSGTKKKIGKINGFDLFEKTIIVTSALNNWQNYAVNETVDHFLWIDVSQSFFEYNSEHLPICYSIQGYEVLLKTIGNSTIQSYLGTSYIGGVGNLTITVKWY